MTNNELLDVQVSAEANEAANPETGFSVNMAINYRNMSRGTFAAFEAAFMDMFKELAESQIPNASDTE